MLPRHTVRREPGSNNLLATTREASTTNPYKVAVIGRCASCRRRSNMSCNVLDYEKSRQIGTWISLRGPVLDDNLILPYFAIRPSLTGRAVQSSSSPYSVGSNMHIPAEDGRSETPFHFQSVISKAPHRRIGGLANSSCPLPRSTRNPSLFEFRAGCIAALLLRPGEGRGTGAEVDLHGREK
ncbi:hypothetical protein K461DRAFT_181641 [Myriangium duriaei CBS 260.36]|uniref:Uncharacterized protein n=1 Tax=Myriangium duriaei CBS 260.36 TaxID=1168546 RepID=A0A9P4ME51_9PEZI|nr:hypothetical protein K461DRAFT_181641 [Myriangium duriaei CBS 260.36]